MKQREAFSMNFFEHQSRALRKSRTLIYLYILAIIAIIAVFHTVVSVSAQLPWLNEWLLVETVVITLIVGGASLFKIQQLKSMEGDGIAESLGGVRINSQTASFSEKRLLHIVEEIALAAGAPIPNVYVLREESSINAFAAGFSPESSVVAVTQGTLDYLNREELQGVIAHEFSHIVHQDTNLNLKIMGVLFGLCIMTIAGFEMIRFAPLFMSNSRSSRENDSTASIGAVLLALGLAFVIIGLVGQLLSNIIRAAVSRQREFLADASAVQYTRNPLGIAGALAKIKFLADGGAKIANKKSAAASHMFFGSPFAPGFFSRIFDSHPDLVTRTKRINPQFDGAFPTSIRKQTEQEIQKDESQRKTTLPPILDKFPFPPRNPARVGTAGFAITAASPEPNATPQNAPPVQATPKEISQKLLHSVGEVPSENITYAEGLLQNIPEEINEFVRTPLGAKALICAFLLPTEDLEISAEGNTLQAAPKEIQEETKKIFSKTRELSKTMKFILAELAYTSLKTIAPAEYESFRRLVMNLIAADKKYDLFEYGLYAILIRNLDRFFGKRRPTTPKFSRLDSSLKEPFQMVLSFFAYSGSDQSIERKKAFSLGCSVLGVDMQLLPQTECRLQYFTTSLEKLTLADFPLRRKILDAFYQCIIADGTITEQESELIRIVSRYLESPVPLTGQLSGAVLLG